MSKKGGGGIKVQKEYGKSRYDEKKAKSWSKSGYEELKTGKKVFRDFLTFKVSIF